MSSSSVVVTPLNPLSFSYNAHQQQQGAAMTSVAQKDMAPATKPVPSTKGLEDYGLLIYDRYNDIFEPAHPLTLPEDCVNVGPDDVLFMVEAPLNAVELYEAILEPKQPFTVHKAPLAPRKIRSDASKTLKDEYLRGQGKLGGTVNDDSSKAPVREVSFIVLPRDAVWQFQMFYHFIWPVQLQYMSIPVRVSGAKTVQSPYALVCYNSHRVYHKKLRVLLRDMKLANDGLERSLLQPGTVPLPETLKEYMDGAPGKDAALPYYVRGRGAGKQRPTTLRRVTTSIPRAVSRVSLRRSRSTMSVDGARK